MKKIRGMPILKVGFPNFMRPKKTATNAPNAPPAMERANKARSMSVRYEVSE